MKRRIGHHHGGGEIIRQRDAIEPARGVIERAGAADDAIEDAAAFGKADLKRELERAARLSTISEIRSCRRWRSNRRSVSRITSTGMMRVTMECFSRSRALERGEQILRRHVEFVAQVFRGLLQFGKIIAVGLDQVADALDRIGLEPGALVAIGHLRGDQGLAAPGFGIGRIQPLQRMRHARAQFGEIAQFLFRQVDLPEQRIGEISFSSAKKRSSSALARSRRSRS